MIKDFFKFTFMLFIKSYKSCTEIFSIFFIFFVYFIACIQVVEDKVFSVQYQPDCTPEASSNYLFDKFIKLMEDEKNA